MATSAVPHESPLVDSHLISSARALFGGLVWGAVMLVVLGFWIRAKYEGTAVVLTNIFLLAAAVAAALAVWQAVSLWLVQETAQQKSVSLGRQRRIFSYVLLMAGMGFLILAVILGMGKKTGGHYGFVADNFAESFGVLLFGLIALGTGYYLFAPVERPRNILIQSLTRAAPALKLVCIVLGLAALMLFFSLPFLLKGAEENRTAGVVFGEFLRNYFPEMAGLLMLSMISFAAVIWLTTGSLDEFGTRLFVLAFGGAVGMILFFMDLIRVYFWRNDIFLGGMSAWQGENSWRFWVCAYVMFIALVLMFASFNLARADIRSNVLLRRVMYGYDTIAQALLLIGILFVLNVVIYARFPFTLDWTKTRGAYALSESSKNLLSNLKKETNFFVLVPQGDLIYKDLRNLMDNCQALNNKLKVSYISPDTDPLEYEKIAGIFPQILPESPMSNAGRGVLIVYGPVPKDEKHATPHSFVAERKLFDINRGDPRGGNKSKHVFKAEGEILKELKFLVQEKKKQQIYILQGNDELDINNEDRAERRDFRMEFASVGIGLLVDKLKKDNFEVSGLSFNKELPGQKLPNIVFAKVVADKKEVPSDCHALIVAGETKPLPQDVLDALDRFMERGGKMLVFFDVTINPEYTKMKDTGLEALVKRYGVEVTDDFPLRLPRTQFDDPRTLLALPPSKSENPLARQFASRTTILKRSARIIKPVDTPGRFKAETVLQIPARQDSPYIVEKNVRAMQDPIRYMFDLDTKQQLVQLISRDPISVAVAVTDSNGDKPRMVVFGDTEFITNPELMASPSRLTNYAFTVSALEWMAERESIGDRPKESLNFQLDPSVDRTRMILLPGWLMLLSIFGLGMGVWIVRRR